MGKSSAERQRNRRERLKAEGKYDAYKKTQSAYRKQWAHKKKREMSSQQKRREREQNANQNTGTVYFFKLIC